MDGIVLRLDEQADDVKASVAKLVDRFGGPEAVRVELREFPATERNSKHYGCLTWIDPDPAKLKFYGQIEDGLLSAVGRCREFIARSWEMYAADAVDEG